MVSFIAGGRTDDLQLPPAVHKAYVLAKDAGHRGPVLGGFLIDRFVCTATPSGVTVVLAANGEVISLLRPNDGDAFTVVVPTVDKSGLILGTQGGSVMLLALSENPSIVAQCSVASSAVTALAVLDSVPGIAIVGTLDGRVLIWDPLMHPTTPSVSLSVSTNSVSAIRACANGDVWIAADKEGIRIYTLTSDETLGVTLAPAGSTVSFEGMQSVTNIVESNHHQLMICLSSCSEVFLIDKVSRQLVHQYPASLMTCGAALTAMIGVEVESLPGSTFLILGGVDGSLCVRELVNRQKDGKLQCVLHKCFDRLSPQSASLSDAPLDPADGCPISSLYAAGGSEFVAGDASCSLFIVKINLQSTNSSVDASPVTEGRDTVTEPSESERSKRSSMDDQEIAKSPIDSAAVDLDPLSIQLDERLTDPADVPIDTHAETVVAEDQQEEATEGGDVRPVSQPDAVSTAAVIPADLDEEFKSEEAMPAPVVDGATVDMTEAISEPVTPADNEAEDGEVVQAEGGNGPAPARSGPSRNGKRGGRRIKNGRT